MRPLARLLVTLIALLAAPLAGNDCGGSPWQSPHDPRGFELFESPQANPLALTPDGSRLYVAHTTASHVEVFDTASGARLATILVGLDPVGIAVRPDGNEVFVSNHISDSVSVIDANPASPTYHEVTATLQDLQNGVTNFDEPVGVAFASNTKAYVALSSRNEIAVLRRVGAVWSVDAQRIQISAQDPRALTVRNGRLYVAAFESGNQSELSVCLQAQAGNVQCTLGAGAIGNAGAGPNLPGLPKNIVRDPDVPDRDLFVFDTTTDAPVGQPVRGVGTLLYGVAVDAVGNVYVSNTDARNAHLDDSGNPDGNGLAAPPPAGLGQGLADLENRIFRNRITRVACGGAACGAPARFDLEEEPGTPVATPLATPYGIALTGDGAWLVVTAAASDRLALVQAASPGLAGVVDAIDVGAGPRGLALFSAPGSPSGRAYVLDTLGNTVSVVDVNVGGTGLAQVDSYSLGLDPTPPEVARGRIAFNTARGSSSGTFACASCHPDANVDQLLWVIGATCDDCDQEEQRSTMPVRGLKNTLPLHWDGTLGDPFGGRNGEVGVTGSAPPVCSLANGQHDCFRHLVNASLSGVMCDQAGCATGPSGLAGELSGEERDDMATYLMSIAYPPARMRPLDDVVSQSARDGFADFFLDQGGNGGQQARTCADTTGGCHALPLGVSTNSIAVGAFEAPTMRGMTDRFLHFSGGFTAAQELLDIVAAIGGANGVIPWSPAEGLDELTVFSAGFVAFQPTYNVFPDDMFQMFEEAGTGTSGATGRMLTLGTQTSAAEWSVLSALEQADLRGVVNLFGSGVYQGVPVDISYKADLALWQVGPGQLTRAQLQADAGNGLLRGTLAAHLPASHGKSDHPQPLLSVVTLGNGPGGDPNVPILTPAGAGNPMNLTAVDVRADARILVDGQAVAGTLSCAGGVFTPFCDTQSVLVQLAAVPPLGLHLLQVQNGAGPISPELPFCVGATVSIAGCL
jgi:YVTN family beta-propeller protein